MVETPGGKQTPGSKASKKVNDPKFGETIVDEEVRSRHTAALSHLPDPALSYACHSRLQSPLCVSL